MLKPQTLLAVRAAVVSASLDRSALLAFIDPRIAAQLPLARTPGEQTLLDLQTLVRIKVTTDGQVPLKQYLDAAIALTEQREEQQVFQRARDEIAEMRPAAAPATVPAPIPAWSTDRVRCYLMAHASDADTLGRLETHLAVLRRTDADLWHAGMVPEGVDSGAFISTRLQEADLIVPILSPAFLASTENEARVKQAFARQKADGIRVIPVLAANADLTGTPFENVVLLPRDKRPLRGRSNADDAYVEIAVAVRNAVRDLRSRRPAQGEAPVAPASVKVAPPASVNIAIGEPAGPPGVPIGDIFGTDRTRDITYVEPAELPQIVTALRTMGGGLLVEGPSQIGKSTAVRKGLGTARAHWIDGRSSRGAEELRAVLARGPLTGHLVVDDVHCLDATLLGDLALFIRETAEHRPAPKGKVTLIGVDHSGHALMQANRQLGFRLHRIPMRPQPLSKILELIEKGEAAANIRFRRKTEIASAAQGSFALAHLLCYKTALHLKVSQATLCEIDESASDVEAAIMEDLGLRFEEPIVRLLQSPGGRACLAVFWLLSQSSQTTDTAGDMEIPVAAAADRFRHLAPDFAWIQEGQLATFLQTNPEMREILHATATKITIADPMVQFYVRGALWPSLAAQAGIRCQVSADRELDIEVPAGRGAGGGRNSRDTRSAAVTPMRSTPLLDTVPYPWQEADAQRLHELLATAYDNVAAATAAASSADVPVRHWDYSGSMWTAWQRLIDLAARSGTLRRLVVDVVLRDTTNQGLWKAIREAIGEP